MIHALLLSEKALLASDNATITKNDDLDGQLMAFSEADRKGNSVVAV